MHRLSIREKPSASAAGEGQLERAAQKQTASSRSTSPSTPPPNDEFSRKSANPDEDLEKTQHALRFLRIVPRLVTFLVYFFWPRRPANPANNQIKLDRFRTWREPFRFSSANRPTGESKWRQQLLSCHFIQRVNWTTATRIQ
jgi:hypothetical protein